GIRLPDVTVPLATHTGWNLRHPQNGAPDRLMGLSGATIPFPATADERAANGDPRRSIAERYASKADYLEQVRREAQNLVDAGYLLAEDLELILGQAGRRYDLLGPPDKVAAAAK
ncbi:MAG TPA: alpha/beta hydrolase domain-containing protein, partial [Stellaceae bacterium]|nr:alpha/beta hydrolase domain-containing protein [Stellaceae bacterium]